MNFLLYKQKMLLYQGDGYFWPHCCMNILYISHRSLYAPTYSFLRRSFGASKMHLRYPPPPPPMAWAAVCSMAVVLPLLIIPAFFFRTKGILISCQSRSVVRPSVRPSVRHVSCKCISSQTVRGSNFKWTHDVEGTG